MALGLSVCSRGMAKLVCVYKFGRLDLGWTV